jgi:hypothetical protein
MAQPAWSIETPPHVHPTGVTPTSRDYLAGTHTSSRRNGGVARLTVRRLTIRPFSDASSWLTTSALPAWRRNQADNPSSFFDRFAVAHAANRSQPAGDAPYCARTQFRRDALRAPARRLQPQHRRHPTPSSHTSADRPSAKEPSRLPSFQPPSHAKKRVLVVRGSSRPTTPARQRSKVFRS